MPAVVSGGRECQTAESQRESFKRKLRDESKNKKKIFHLKLARKKYLFTSRFLSENTAPNRYELDWNRHRSCRQPPLPGPLLSVSFHRASDGRKYRSKKLLFLGISLLNFKFKKTQEKNYERERIPGKKIWLLRHKVTFYKKQNKMGIKKSEFWEKTHSYKRKVE